MRCFTIVSLWEMLRIDTSDILTPLTYLAGTVKFMQVNHRLVQSHAAAYTPMQDEEKISILACIRKLKDASDSLELGASRYAAATAFENCVARFKAFSRFGHREQADTIDELTYLIKSFSDDMKSVCALTLPLQSAERYERPEESFGRATIEAFISTEFDVQEAGKCFALQRFTACVFHCMRIMEVGLEALANELRIDVATNWNKALNLVEKEIRGRSVATHGEAWKSDEAFFSEAATHFRVVKNAWRNHTMHKREVFDEERARGILQSTADFMRHLASRLSE
jgi:hypothetical protein